mgnify:FL=1
MQPADQASKHQTPKHQNSVQASERHPTSVRKILAETVLLTAFFGLYSILIGLEKKGEIIAVFSHQYKHDGNS